MIVALDYDRTYTRAPGLFNPMIDEASRARSLSVWCITRREDTPENRREIEDAFGERFPLLGGLILCGPNRQKQDAAREAGIDEKIPSAGYRGGEARAIYDGIDFTPPAGVREEAARALAWRREFGRGGTEVGIARGRDLSNGTTISPDTARRMVSYFARHEVDKDGATWPTRGAGWQAWHGWGGDAGARWSRRVLRALEND